MPTDAADEVANLLSEHGKELEERSAQIRETVAALEQREVRTRELHFRVEQVLRDGALELDLRQAELSARASDLDAREAAVDQAEEKVESRRRSLGAVELRAAAAARREDAVRLREHELERRVEELTQRARELEDSGVRAAPVREDEHVVITAAGAYALRIRPGAAPGVGHVVELGDALFVCVRVAASPLPGDDRRCALLEPATRDAGSTEPGVQ